MAIHGSLFLRDRGFLTDTAALSVYIFLFYIDILTAKNL